jgi:hypothetical protein
MGSTNVKWGWIIRDQAAVVQGMNFGPGWLQGKTRQGRVNGGCHNLIGKDVVFHAKGKSALGAIVDQMIKMTTTKVRCGIRKGMQIEKFQESEYGGGMDQIRVTATDKEVVRMPYYLHAFADEPGAYQFNTLVSTFASTAAGMSTAQGAASTARGAFDSVAWIHGKTAGLAATKMSNLQEAMKAKKVYVVLTSNQMLSRSPIVSHRHTHTLPNLAKDIQKAVLHGR